MDATSEQASGTCEASEERSQRTTVYIQDECLKHRFIRSRDTSGVVERPERLRAVKIGLSAAVARVEEASSTSNTATPKNGGKFASSDLEADSLAIALESMQIAPIQEVTVPVTFTRTKGKVDLLNHPAVKYVHGDIDGDLYLESLIAWARDSKDNIVKKGLEIPPGIPPLDLYLCPTSIDAIQGAIGAVCEAVDTVLATGTDLSSGSGNHCERAFVAIRPPGHHCGEDTPCGFCFVNNVVIGAAHAHLKHGIKRAVILDIDLHHGNGTQSLVWQINEETYRQTLEREDPQNNAPLTEHGLQVYYGSLHDVLSFPCEDGKPEMVQAASTSIHGAHGQHIENIHLQRYDTSEHFWDVLYPTYLTLLQRARDFLDNTGGPGDDILILISCGFDACEHEYPSMSRHNRKVPTSFYHRFTRDTCALADQYARGRLVSVLEGGYSDRALISGAMAHLCGLVDLGMAEGNWVNEEWWEVEKLIKLEKATKTRKSRPSQTSTSDNWVFRAAEILTTLDPNPSTGSRNYGVPPTSSTLRRQKKGADFTPSDSDSTTRARSIDAVDLMSAGAKIVKGMSPSVSDTSTLRSPSSGNEQERLMPGTDASSSGDTKKKLPRVILHVRPPADAS
ncbi:arginase deacetylase [Scleroderma citrinum]